MNESLTYYDNGLIRMDADLWYCFEEESELIKEKTSPEYNMFAINVGTQTVLSEEEEFSYEDMDCPIVLVHYDADKEDVDILIGIDDVCEYLSQVIGIDLTVDANWVTDIMERASINDAFNNIDGHQFILVYGDQLVATSFDIVGEESAE